MEQGGGGGGETMERDLQTRKKMLFLTSLGFARLRTYSVLAYIMPA